MAYGYTYYKNELKKTFTGPDNITYEYLYDDNNQLTGVQIPNVGIISVNEYTWDRPASMILPGGSTKAYTYDPLMRIQSIDSKDPGQNVLMNYQYTYDKMDNILSKDTEHGDYDYGYDNLYRLTTADNPTLNAESYTYDRMGNRLTSADVTGDWTYNQNNELGGYGDVSYVYDANGNAIQKTDGGVVINYIYNEENRLAEVRDGSGSLIASYYYDPFGRRLWKDVGGTRTYFQYADEGLVAEYDGTGAAIKTYGYNPDSIWTTDPLFMKENGDYYFYQNDHLGTPQKMMELNGAVVWGAAYSAFGEAEVDVSSTVINNLRFPGQYYDNETGLHYNYHRFYDSGAGRYLRKDPMGFRGGLNLFAYVDNNPINYFDPKGLGWCGSGWFGFLISDKPSGYDFTSCCKDHDKCYENDPETGYCNMTKPKCDERFLRCMTKVVDEMDIPDLPPKIELDDGIRFYNYPKNKQESMRIANDYYYGVSEFWGFGDRAWKRTEGKRRSQECYRTYHE